MKRFVQNRTVSATTVVLVLLTHRAKMIMAPQTVIPVVTIVVITGSAINSL